LFLEKILSATTWDSSATNTLASRIPKSRQQYRWLAPAGSVKQNKVTRKNDEEYLRPSSHEMVDAVAIAVAIEKAPHSSAVLFRFS